MDSLGDAQLVIGMLVGALQRLLRYPEQGFMITQEPTGPGRAPKHAVGLLSWASKQVNVVLLRSARDAGRSP